MKNETQYFGKDLEAMSFAYNYHKWILEEFTPYLGAHVAEVGAGMGHFSEFLLETQINHLTTFEPSENMYPVLENNFAHHNNVDTIHAFFEDQSHQYNQSFDSICYVNGLEHIEKDREALTHAYKTLQQNGHILIFVPALSFLYSNFDKAVGHYRRYSKKELVDVVSAAGFSIKKINYFDIAGIIPWYVAFVLLKQTTTESNVSLYDTWVVPIMKKVERIIPPIIGKNLILIGQKA